jgi:hypothetical protein
MKKYLVGQVSLQSVGVKAITGGGDALISKIF